MTDSEAVRQTTGEWYADMVRVRGHDEAWLTKYAEMIDSIEGNGALDSVPPLTTLCIEFRPLTEYEKALGRWLAAGRIGPKPDRNAKGRQGAE